MGLKPPDRPRSPARHPVAAQADWPHVGAQGTEKGPPPQCRGDAALRARYLKGGDLDPGLCDPQKPQGGSVAAVHAARVFIIRHPTGNVPAHQI